MQVGLSEIVGAPGSHAVASWPVSHLVHALLMAEAHESAKRYATRKSLAMGGARG